MPKSPWTADNLAESRRICEGARRDGLLANGYTMSCTLGHAWKEGEGRREGPSEWTGGVVVELCPQCGEPGLPL
jgi:hypothetical protein